MVTLLIWGSQVIELLKERIENISQVYGDSLSNLHNSDGADKRKKRRAFDLRHDLHTKLYDGFILGQKDWEWDDLRELCREVRTAERQFGLERGHYQGVY